MKLPNRNTMLRAMRDNNAKYNGRFFVGVTSTGIYCLPTCTARMPLEKNIVFYPTREDAIAAGLRGCKRCHSESYPDVLPAWLHALLDHMKINCSVRLTETELMKISKVEISTVRRHFKTQMNTTPAKFHRKIRLNHALSLIEEGQDYLSAAYDCGWESASAFRRAFQLQFGKPPGRFYARV